MAKNVPHIKTFLQLSNPLNGVPPSIEWLCLTSHNLSKAAWGEFQNSSGSTSKVLFIRHWELGVFISPATLAKKVTEVDGDCKCHCVRIFPYTCSAVSQGPITIDCNDESSSEGIVNITIPLPYDAINPERYGNGDVPWTVDGGGKALPDSFGMIGSL
jgi:tyrosyl-DNA phosphodiesterase-1